VISVQQTIEILKQNQPPRKIIEVALMQSLGMVLAAEISAKIASPPYTNSAMGGFAVHWADVQNATVDNPAELSIIGESSAGSPFSGRIEGKQAIGISTGAIVPAESDAIIPVEHTTVDQDVLKVFKASQKHQHIRFAGEEYSKGQKLLDPGIEIKSGHIALIASQGISHIKVYKKPAVTIMTTGSELVPFDAKAESYQLRDSNTPMLISAVLEAGAEIKETIHIKDDPKQTLKKLEQAARNSDIIISSGGVSMGRHDHVRDMALKAGFNELFWKVKQKPGKPMFLAGKGRTLLIALPGNPVSAYICFKHYVRPLLQSIWGKGFNWPTKKACALKDIANNIDRTQLMRVKLNTSDKMPCFNILEKQGSHMSSSIAHADGYIILEAGVELKKGSESEVFLF
jgi:molybdopterin molybdotransferase